MSLRDSQYSRLVYLILPIMFLVFPLQLSTVNNVQNKQDAWTCIEAADDHSSASSVHSACDASVSIYHISHSFFKKFNKIFTFLISQSLDQMPTDIIRKNLLAMAKHPCFDEQNRQSLLEVVSLINNLESLSNDGIDFLPDNDNFILNVSK